MIRFNIVLPVFAAALALAPATFAKDIKETRTFTKADGTKIVAHTNFNTTTDVTTEKVTATRTDGQVRTVSEKTSPDAGGGLQRLEDHHGLQRADAQLVQPRRRQEGLN